MFSLKLSFNISDINNQPPMVLVFSIFFLFSLFCSWSILIFIFYPVVFILWHQVIYQFYWKTQAQHFTSFRWFNRPQIEQTERRCRECIWTNFLPSTSFVCCSRLHCDDQTAWFLVNFVYFFFFYKCIVFVAFVRIDALNKEKEQKQQQQQKMSLSMWLIAEQRQKQNATQQVVRCRAFHLQIQTIRILKVEETLAKCNRLWPFVISLAL